MISRFFVGLLKGLSLGALIGAALSYGARLAMPGGGLLAYLLAMGVGGTTGIFGGKAPWREGAWIEALLKCLFGVGLSALLYWLCVRYVHIDVPGWFVGVLAMPASLGNEPLPLLEVPMLVLSAIGAVYGSIVELDHTASDAATRPDAPRARKPVPNDSKLATASTVEDAEVVDDDRPNRRTR